LGIFGGALLAAGLSAGDRLLGVMDPMLLLVDATRTRGRAVPHARGYRHAVDERFAADMRSGYPVGPPAVTLGSPLRADEVLSDVRVRLPLSTVNRHGLVAGATGTGKTKTLQVIAGQLSDAGVPVFVADVKGDLSGLAQPIDASDPKVAERAASLDWTVEPSGHAVELLSLTGTLGAPGRATVESFGPVLLAKVLDLNETQTAVLTLVFRLCDDLELPLLDLSDLRTALRFLGSDQGRPVLGTYGGVSRASIGVVLRSILGLEEPAPARSSGSGLRRVRPDADRRRARCDHLARALRRDGPTPPVLDVHAVAARAPVRDAARGRRPGQTGARVLPRRGAPAVRRRVGRAPRTDRAHRPPDPLEGGRCVLRDARADRRPDTGPEPTRQPDPTSRFERSRPRTRTTCERPRARSPSPSTTTSRRR